MFFSYCDYFCLFSETIRRLFPIAISVNTLLSHRNSLKKNMAAISLKIRLTSANTNRQKTKQNASIPKNNTKFKCISVLCRISISPTNSTNNNGTILPILTPYLTLQVTKIMNSWIF